VGTGDTPSGGNESEKEVVFGFGTSDPQNHLYSPPFSGMWRARMMMGIRVEKTANRTFPAQLTFGRGEVKA